MLIVQNPRHASHNTQTINGRSYDSWEQPARVDTILSAVQEAHIGPVIAPKDYGTDPLIAVHDLGFVNFLQSAYATNVALVGDGGPLIPEAFPTRNAMRQPERTLGVAGYYAMDADTPILEGTWAAAYESAQCSVTAADHLIQGESAVYALCRPPGHHAYADMYGGFCYLNNLAIGVRYLQRHDRLGPRVAVLDIDYHHGNGTQSIFYADPTVMVCSLHGHPDIAYPYYSGMADERGKGEGFGFNRNFPLLRDTDIDVYLGALDQALTIIQDFAPHYLAVSAGFDIAQGDPYGNFMLRGDDMHRIGTRVASLKVPTLIVQEGGYRLDTLGAHVVAFLSAFP